MITKEQAEQRIFLREIRVLDDYIWMDIAKARRSWAIINIFLKDLQQKTSEHYWNKDAPMFNALWAAAIDSVIISLGRLLNPRGDQNECTLAQYRNKVLEYLKKYGPARSESNHAKESLQKLRSRVFLRQLKAKENEYRDQIMPWRNKITAHTEIGASVALPKKLPEIIEFVENVHRICHSAMEDAGMRPGPYLSDAFESISEDWVNCLISRCK